MGQTLPEAPPEKVAPSPRKPEFEAKKPPEGEKNRRAREKAKADYRASRRAELHPEDALIKKRAYEVANEHYQLWSIAAKFLTRCADTFGISYCQKNDISNNRKIPVLVNIIKDYNLKLKNPDFEGFIDEDEPEELENGAKVFLPPKEYVEQAIKRSQEDASKEQHEMINPIKVPMYAGPNAAKMEKNGRKRIAPPDHLKEFVNSIVAAKDPTTHEELHPEDPTIYGKMTTTKAIIIHSTEGSADGLRHQDGYVHFILNEHGVVEVVHRMDIASNHAGSSTWEGLKNIAHQTVGIEVVNTSMPKLIRDGKINVALDKKAKVELVKIIKTHPKGKKKGQPIIDKRIGKPKFRMVLITATPPAQKAINAGFRQARIERDFTDAQYETLKGLIAYIGSKKGLHYKDVVTHSMVASNAAGRGRKSDPPVLNWNRLGLPNNHYRVDPDVANGTVKANITDSENSRTGKKMTMVKYKGKTYYEVLPSKIDGKDTYSYFPEARFGGTESITAGVKAAEKIYQANKRKKNKK